VAAIATATATEGVSVAEGGTEEAGGGVADSLLLLVGGVLTGCEGVIATVGLSTVVVKAERGGKGSN
jgi:hypothetical protein